MHTYRLSAVRAGMGACPYSGCILSFPSKL